jgi:hypothetical protein
MEFYSDYHEHDDFQPAMLVLSHFVIQWNWAEHNFNVLLWQHAGDMLTGSMFTAALGNQSRADALLALARKNEKNAKVLELTEFAIKAFGTIKSNRNSLVHAHSVHFGDPDEKEKKPKWVRASSNPKSIHVFCYADIDDIIENLNATAKLALLLSELIIYYAGPKKPEPTLGTFPLPKVLVPIPIAHHAHGFPAEPPKD